ncbi:MAG: hypothetical protein AB1422_12295 [bacterium]
MESKNIEVCFRIEEIILNLIGDGCYSNNVPISFCVGNKLAVQLCLRSFDLKVKNYLIKNIKYISNKNYYEINGEILSLLEAYSWRDLLIDCGVPIRVSVNKEEEKLLYVKKGEYLSGTGYLYGDFESIWENNHLIQKIEGRIVKIEECLKSEREICLQSREINEFKADILTQNSIYITLGITR